MNKKDIIHQSLDENLKKFLEFFSQDLPKYVLDIDKDAKSAEYFKQLERVSRSLDLYSKKDRELFYIGFLGSYSSGKSSTINTILDLWESKHERPTGINPTDDHITLITNDDNSDLIFSLAREESLVSSRSRTQFDIDFLKDIVIMDTPGSGDANILKSIVRDSLPLCDLIVYVLNATSPFTENDIPILRAKQEKLKDIPIMFVLTRGDEFSLNKQSSLNETNFDTSKYSSELKILVSRINDTIENSEFTADNFVLIDNLSKFGVSKFKKRLLDFTQEGKNGINILHNHKLNYFRNEVKSIYEYYLSLIEYKLITCNNLIEKSKSNLQVFNNRLEIVKSKHINIWSNYNKHFNIVHNNLVDKFLGKKLLTPLQDEISDYVNSKSYENFINSNIDKLLEEGARKRAEQYTFSLKTKISNKLDNHKKTVLSSINYSTFELDKSNKSIENLFSDFEIDISLPIERRDLINLYSIEYEKHDNKNQNLIRKTYDELNLSIQNLAPLDKVHNLLDNYKTELLSAFQDYYSIIEMYTIAVFSSELKSYMSDLGLSEKIEEIEKSKIDTKKYDAVAEKKLFEEINLKTKELRISLSQFSKNIQSRKSKIDEIRKKIKIVEPEKQDSLLKNNDTEEYFTNSYLKNSLENIIGKIDLELFRLKMEMEKLKRKHRNQRRVLIVSSLIIGAAISLLFTKYSDVKAPESIAYGFLSSVVLGIASNLVVKATNYIKNAKKKLIEKFKTNNIDKVNDHFESLFIEFENKITDNQYSIKYDLHSIWKREVARIFKDFEKQIKPKEEIINEVKDILINEIIQYDKEYSKFDVFIRDYFNNYEKNIEHIDSVGKIVKDDSTINSFELLNKTYGEIKKVKFEVENLRTD